MDKIKKRIVHEVVISSAIIAALAFGVVALGFFVRANAKSIQELRGVLYQKSLFLNSYTATQVIYRDKVEPYRAILYNIFPEKDKLVNFSSDLQSLARSTRVDFGFSFVGDEPAGDASFGSLHFSLNLKGTFSELYRFIESMEKFKYFIGIDSFVFVRNNRAAGAAEEIEATVRGRVYYR